MKYLLDLVHHQFLISDNAANLTNKTMKTLCESWKVKHITISGYHASANRAERVNKDLVRMLATYVNEAHNDWDVHLQKFAMCLRCMVNDTTGVSPALLVLGKEIVLPVDRIFYNEDKDLSMEAISKIAKSVPESLQAIMKTVRDKIRRKHQINKTYYDSKRREVHFDVGQKVWVLKHPLSKMSEHKTSKFEPKYDGPYEILSKNNDTYILNLPKKMTPKRHISDLKIYNEPVVTLCEEREKVASVEYNETARTRDLRPRKNVNYREKDLRKK